MARKKQTPAEVVIEAFGVRPLAAELECSPTTVLRWRDSPTLAGTIPVIWHKPILALAEREQHAEITAEILLYGR